MSHDPDYIYNRGLVSRALPSTNADQAWAGLRSSSYGEQFVQLIGNPRQSLAMEGSYFIAHNPTNDAATTLAGHTAPVLADADVTMTKPFLFCRMDSAATTRAILDYVQIEVITAGVNGTADSWAAQLDTGATRVTTAGTDLTRLNPNMASSATPSLAVQGGVVVTGAESASVRHLAHGQFRPTIQVAGDKYTFVFGGEPSAFGTGAIATIAHHVVPLPPVILGATDQFLLALYSPSQSAAGIYKVRMGWYERYD